MIRAWRLTKSKYLHGAFDGEGARRFGGRWNSPGTAVVYTSSSAAQSLTELLVHVDSSSLLSAYVLVPVDFEPALVEAPKTSQLPRGWNDYPASRTVQSFGDRWVAQQRSAVLCLPSVVVPMENNYLLNPRHADFAAVRIGQPIRFPIDARLIQRGS